MAEGKKRINSKTKGSGYELKIAKILSRYWGEEFNRTPMSGGLHWKQDNRVAGDIVTPPNSIYPWTTECKKREEWSLEQVLKGTGDVEKWWAQAVGDGERVGLRPLLIFSKNFAPDYVMLAFNDFETIMKYKGLFSSQVPFNYFVVHKVGTEMRVVLNLNDFVANLTKDEVIKALELK